MWTSELTAGGVHPCFGMRSFHGAPSHIDSLYRSSHFALDPLLDHFQRSRHKERSQELISRILRRFAGILSVVLLIATIYAAFPPRALAESVAKERTLHCFFLLDRSGSMTSLAADAIHGFNQYVAQQQQQEGPMLLTLAHFDDHQPFDLLYEARNIRDVPILRQSDFRPRGRAPLCDSLAELIRRADKYAGRGAELVIVIFSDSRENASRKHSHSDISKLVEQRRRSAVGWTFVFLGANQAALKRGPN